MEYLPAYVKILAYLFVVVYMLSIPLETTRGEIVTTRSSGWPSMKCANALAGTTIC